jgi:hypothetical protein
MSDPQLRWLSPTVLLPNPWNPNAMTPEMYDKAVASIRSFGFVDPITVRPMPEGDHEMDGWFQIIDGEHRWKAARAEGLLTVPVFDVGFIDDDVARQLTIVLNETRGQADPQRLGALLRDLASRANVSALLATLPYTREAFDRLTGLNSIDWTALQQPPDRLPVGRPSAWVERVYRMPTDAAEVLDRAIQRIRDDDDGVPDWRALELLAADYLGN